MMGGKKHKRIVNLRRAIDYVAGNVRVRAHMSFCFGRSIKLVWDPLDAAEMFGVFGRMIVFIGPKFEFIRLVSSWFG